MARRSAKPKTRSALDILDDFVTAADELAATRLIREGFETCLTIYGGEDPPMTVLTPMPDEDDFSAPCSLPFGR